MSLQQLITTSENGYFGDYGGRYVAENLVPVIDELRDAYFKYKDDPEFLKDLQDLYRNYSGRMTPLSFCKNLTEKLGGAQIYIKNEGLNHTGAHKINHCLGQILIAKRLGKKRIIAETGAGQHGVATATVCAKMGFECVIYMGKKDYDRQRPNVFSMQQLGATVVPVLEGCQTLRDAVNAGLQDLINNPEDTHYLLGTACGPHPYPAMNASFQSVIGKEVRTQLLEQTGRSPDCLIACVGGGSNSLGLFTDFLDDKDITLVGVEAGGKGITGDEKTCDHAARMQTGSVGINEGFKSYMLQTKEGQIQNTHSISAGLDYSGVSPQLSYLRDIGRVEFTFATDDKVLEAYKAIAMTEGILPALESAHAVAEAIERAPKMKKDEIIVINVS
ncbi:UNVERIFIED_CONTAM: hypothetical protein GTU68_057119, partial [Idotea baltica]|nr:hypothetical protein [Idotea baltica]